MKRKQIRRNVWGSAPLAKSVVESDDLLWKIREEALECALTDTPSTNDLRYALLRYNESTPSERDAMDTVFVWFTGYTLRTLARRSKSSRE